MVAAGPNKLRPEQRTLDALHQRLSQSWSVEPMVDQRVVKAVEILQPRSEWPVSGLAAAVGLSERQPRRRFEAAVGYGPKRLGRILRFQRLLDLLHAGHHRVYWSELAVQAGYADQSQMINECQALAGEPPTALPGAVAVVGPLDGMSVSSNTAGDGAP